MAKTINQNQIPADIAMITKNLLLHVNDYEIAGLSELAGLYKRRIHNNGEATDGSKIGNYKSAQYKAFRVLQNRQVSYKDLELYGDLRRSEQIGVSNGRNVFGFTRDLSRLIAEGQQEQTGKIIFGVSDKEQQAADDAYIRELNYHFNQIS